MQIIEAQITKYFFKCDYCEARFDTLGEATVHEKIHKQVTCKHIRSPYLFEVSSKDIIIFKKCLECDKITFSSKLCEKDHPALLFDLAPAVENYINKNNLNNDIK